MQISEILIVNFKKQNILNNFCLYLSLNRILYLVHFGKIRPFLYFSRNNLVAHDVIAKTATWRDFFSEISDVFLALPLLHLLWLFSMSEVS